MATPFRLSCNHSLPTHTITTFHHYTSAYPFSDLLHNYPSSVRCVTKQIANPSHQLQFIVSHPLTLQQPASWIPFINNVSNNYYSLDCNSPCHSPNHFKQLQWGFQLTHNTIFFEHVILSEYHPGNTSRPNLEPKLTTKTFRPQFMCCIYFYHY